MGDILPWHDIYVNMLTLDNISIAEKILRPAIIYLCLIIGLRLVGKRELAQLNPLDLIVILTLSNTVQNAIIGADNSVTGGLIGAAALLGTNEMLVRLSYRFPRFDRFFNGAPILLIEKGELQEQNLKRLLIDKKELVAVCRRQGVKRLSDVDTATLETSGSISVFLREPSPEEAHFRRLDERLARIEAAITHRP
jgi:uncharacterized membrane protein YcaP (DUF421 family)